MKINSIYFSILSIFLFSACSDPEIPMEENPPEQPLKLSYPLINDDVHYCCFALEWEDGNEDEEYRVQIAKFSSFNDLLFDTLVSGTSVEFPSFLTPRNSYYWRVIPENPEETQKSDFRIIDYADYLMGSHAASINSYSWLAGQGSSDTTHQTTLKIWKGDDHSISYNSTHSSEKINIPFSGLRKQGYVLYNIDHNYPNDSDFIEYHFEADSIVAYSAGGGNGGGGHTRIIALKE